MYLACGRYVLIYFIWAICFSTSTNISSHLEKGNQGKEYSNAVGSETVEIQFQNVTDSALETTLKKQDSKHDITKLTSSQYFGDYTDYEDFNLSLIGPEVLVDLAPMEMVLSQDQRTSKGKKKPVKDGFVAEQEVELLRLHNFYRQNVTPPAADMSFMEWNTHLAKTAQEWANQCQFRHGFPPNSGEPMGQNLYMGFDPTGVRALLLWYEEYQHFNMKTLECLPNKQCGHYTQMAWGGSDLLGCGMKRCGQAKFLVVCHYRPPGNVVGRPPYIVGQPCSQCSSADGGLCAGKLCAESMDRYKVAKAQCTKNQMDCECPLKCHNCGNLNKDTCKCDCPDGWDSLDCSRRCDNNDDRCGKNPGWPSSKYCVMNQNIADMYCRKMCGRCQGIEPENSKNICCNGEMCDDGHVLDLCQCKLLCPGPKCYERDSGAEYPSRNISMIFFSLLVLFACNL